MYQIERNILIPIKNLLLIFNLFMEFDDLFQKAHTPFNQNLVSIFSETY